MTFGFLVGYRNFIGLFWVSWEDFVLHEHDCIHCAAKSCTTTAYRWLFRDSLSSLRTLWSAVIQSPKCSALGTTVPARLLQEALVIFVFKQKSQFGSYTLCWPEPSSTFARGSIGSSWDDLEVSWLPCSGIPQGSVDVLPSTKFSLNSCRKSGNSCEKSLCTSSDAHFYFCLRFLWFHAAGLPQALHSYFHFFLILDFKCICWHEIRNPVMKMMEK